MRRRVGKKLVLLGPAGSFSDAAADRFALGFKRIYVYSFSDLFQRVHGDYLGFVPVRNKIAGEIKEAVYLLKKKNIEPVRKFRMLIKMALVAQRQASLNSIKHIYAPLIVKKQCGIFIKKHLRTAVFHTNFASSSLAFKKIVQLKGKKAYDSAAIGSEKATKIFKLRILARNIQDDSKDWTEFLLFRLKREKKQ